MAYPSRSLVPGAKATLAMSGYHRETTPGRRSQSDPVTIWHRQRRPLKAGRNQTLCYHGGHVMIARRLASLVASALVLAACSGHAAPATPALPNLVIPGVVQKGGGGQFVQFTPKTIGALYSAIVQGPDGDMWFLDENAAQLVRMSVSGTIKE